MFAHTIKTAVRTRALHRGLTTPSVSSIPIIDFSAYKKAASRDERIELSYRMVDAFKTMGFVYLSGHGVDESFIKHTFNKSANFFKLPAEIKSTLAWQDPRSNRGYVAFGRERVTQSADPNEIAALRTKAPDYKESMEIGRDWDSTWKNMWPSEADAPGFKQTMLDFYETCHELHRDVMRSIALGLDLQEHFFDNKVDEKCHNLRLLAYPEVKRSLLEEEGTARAGAHSDYGTLTLLFQDNVGGLQVQHPHSKEYIPATPIPGTIVINVGDLLSRWSNDVLRSTLHRVVAPPTKQNSSGEAVSPARQSIAFFCNPNMSQMIETLPNCGESKYPPVETEQYIVGRLKATYL